MKNFWNCIFKTFEITTMGFVFCKGNDSPILIHRNIATNVAI